MVAHGVERSDAATFVRFVEHAGELWAVVADGHSTRLTALCPAARVVHMAQHIAATIHRLNSADERMHLRALAALRRDATELDACLLGPLHLAGDVPVIIVPTGAMNGVLWRSLPTLTERCFSLIPSTTWWRSTAQPERLSRPRGVFVAGPGLPGAEQEVRSLADEYGEATILFGGEADVAATLAALERSTLAHIAAHGVTRTDNPMFSRIELADGGLTLYDWGTLSRVPELVVLSACDAATGRVFASDGVVSTAVAVLELGARCVVAALAKVEDEATRRLMLAFHRELRSGKGAPDALASAAADAVASGYPADVAAACAFVTIGRT
jgi:hypothetical protein